MVGWGGGVVTCLIIVKGRFGQVGDQVSQVKDQVGQGQGQELDNIFISQSWESLLLWLTFVKTSFFKPEYVSQWTVISIDIKRSWDTIYQRYYEFRDITISLAKISYSEIWLSDGLTDIDESRVVFETDIRKGKTLCRLNIFFKIENKVSKGWTFGKLNVGGYFCFSLSPPFSVVSAHNLWYTSEILPQKLQFIKRNKIIRRSKISLVERTDCAAGL